MIQVRRLLVRVIALGVVIAGLGATGPSSQAAPTPSCVVTSTYGGSASIPPNVTGYTSPTITIPADPTDTVADVDVQLWFTNPGGLDVAVRDGDDTAKVADLAGAFGTYDGARFDDEAAGALAGDPPYSGRYQPEVSNALAVFDGGPVGDPWQLVFTSTSPQTAQLSTWRVIVTYAGCVPDNDSDGVPNTKDACPNTAAHTASGCPRFASTVTVTTTQTRWSGHVGSSSSACRAGRAVALFQQRSGPDRRLRTMTTGSGGRWSTGVHLRHGTYYTVVARRVVRRVAECAAARSPLRHL